MRLDDWYPDFPDANTHIDDFDIPDECRRKLKRTGIEYVGDVLDVYARIRTGGGMDDFPRMSSKCYSHVYRAIIRLEGCPWRDDIEKWLVEWVEKE